MRTKFCLSLLVLLTSCGSYIPLASRNHWRYESTNATSPHFCSRIILSPSQPCSTLQFEIIRSTNGCRFYVSTTCLTLNAESERCEVPFAITIDEEIFSFRGRVFAGGQRMEAPEEAMHLLIDSILKDKSVTFSVGFQKVELTKNSFLQSWLRLRDSF